jgi:hypothetical protein
MKTKITGLLLILILLMIGLPGCDILEELDKPDYITVNVDAFANVKIGKWIDGQNVVVAWPNTQVEISIVKAGGEHVDGFRTTDSSGITSSLVGSFKLYREQNISVLVSVTPNSAIPEAVGGGAFDPAKHFLYNAWEELSWAQVYASKDFGETYNWYTTVMAQADVT